MVVTTASATHDPSKARRTELILRQIDSLPTLPAVATRLLVLTIDDDSHASEVVELISSDAALTSRILSLARRADKGIRGEINTVHNAVVMLGFNAVRNAVLSIKVFEMFRNRGGLSEDPPGAGEAPPSMELDRMAFWRHCLAVAIASEQLAALADTPEVNPSEAFVCGLMHDVGKLALDFVLPKSFGRVVELVEINQGNITEYERRIIGIDHHTAGKRLAEQWQLSHMVQDCIWLHGSPYEMLPRLPHRRMIGVVSLADLLARRSHLGYSGNFSVAQDAEALALAVDLDPQKVEAISQTLHVELERRCTALGLDEEPSHELYIRSIQQANQMLGRLNAVLERRGRATARQAQLLEAIAGFHAGAAPGRGVADVLSGVIECAGNALGAGFYAMVYQPAPGEHWQVCQISRQGTGLHVQMIEPPSSCDDLSHLDASQLATLNVMGFMPWLADHLASAPDLREVRVLPLGCGWGTAALLLHDRPVLPPWTQLVALTSTWGAAIAAANQHDGARRLGEDLAQANRALAETQDRLLQAESLTRLGEMAAGAAHEMNNPLAIISGRAQLLAQVTEPGTKEHQAVAQITEQAHRLSDLISGLRMYADPPRAQRQPTRLYEMLDRALRQARESRDLPRDAAPVDVQFQVPEAPLETSIDGDLIEQAVVELALNALQSPPRSMLRITVRIEPVERVLLIEVADDGPGMDAHTLAHAPDPFFSSKSAGRRVGLGLPRAQLMAAAHGGRVELRSAPNKGTVATLYVPLDSLPGSTDTDGGDDMGHG
ncbi:MAG: HDOD domain-containing protein [Phycisphaeraceae bacterium]